MSRDAIVRICREALASLRTENGNCSKVCAHPVFYKEVIALCEDKVVGSNLDAGELRRIFGSRRWVKMDSSEEGRSIINGALSMP